jgi:CheY-like chemotaxis protein
VTDNSQPSVLVIDDESEAAESVTALIAEQGVRATYCLPSEIECSELARADLILMDLGIGKLTETELVRLEPPDGLALAAALRRHPCVLNNEASPVGIALLSGKVDELSAPFPPQSRTHLLARHHNLEWVFLKSDPHRAKAIGSLARAIHEIPKTWGDGIQSPGEVVNAFGLIEATDLENCWDEIERCHPPIYEITQWSHGLAFVRWLLHQVLTYPCFLWDSYRVAARLRISHAAFLELEAKPPFRALIRPSEYTGMLSDFGEQHWWRHRIEKLAWDLTAGDSQNTAALRSALSGFAGTDVQPSTVEQPLVCLDSDYRPLEDTYSVQSAVRVQPDDWPSYADYAWMPLDVVRGNAALQALVVHEDRERIVQNAP